MRPPTSRRIYVAGHQPVNQQAGIQTRHRLQYLLESKRIVQLLRIAAHGQFEEQRSAGHPLQLSALYQADAAQIVLHTAVRVETVDAIDPETQDTGGRRRGRVPGRQAIGKAVHTVRHIPLPFRPIAALGEGPAQCCRTASGGAAPHQQQIGPGRPGRTLRVQQRILCGPTGNLPVGGQHDRHAPACRRCEQKLPGGSGGLSRRGNSGPWRCWRWQLGENISRQNDQRARPVVPPHREVGHVEAPAEGPWIETDTHLSTRYRLVAADQWPCWSEPLTTGGVRSDPALASDPDKHLIERASEGCIQRRPAEARRGYLCSVEIRDWHGLRPRPEQRACQEGQQQLGLHAGHVFIIATPVRLGRLPITRLNPSEIMTSKQPLTYKDAGVDIDAGDHLVEHIKPLARATHRPGVLGGIGGFGGLFEIDLTRWPRPVLVSGTDGVGTKLKLAIELGRYDTIGIDLVAMCANDVIVQGAEPLFFLDYLSTGRLQPEIAESIVGGMAAACRDNGCALLGGETAEMPGLYQHGDFDLAGTIVGIVERDRVIDGSVRTGLDKLATALRA